MSRSGRSDAGAAGRAPRLDPGEIARVTFLGAAGEVTGSSYLVETSAARVLIDCGMFQGGRDEERKNRARFGYRPAALDAALLTHAHIDHCGLLPRLVREGYRGSIRATAASADVTRVMLADSAEIQESDAARENRRNLRRGRGHEVEPLYTIDDAQRASAALAPLAFGAWTEVARGVRARFRFAGHILGAASIELEVMSNGAARRIAFSGDIGRFGAPLLKEPESPEPADLVVMEATYGDRDHRSTAATVAELAEILEVAATTHENVIVPVFALGRAQEVLYHLHRLQAEGRMRPRPVYLDSPMAIDVTDLYRRHADSLKSEARNELRRGESPLACAGLRFTRTADESKAINQVRGAIILSASGMCDGGRVLHHLRHNLWKPGAHVVLAGFQARGSLGRRLVDREPRVRIHGEEVAVRATIHTLGGFSAHADRSQLLQWLAPLAAKRPAVALVHAEPEKQEAFASVVRERFSLECLRPARGDAIVLAAGGARMARSGAGVGAA